MERIPFHIDVFIYKVSFQLPLLCADRAHHNTVASAQGQLDKGEHYRTQRNLLTILVSSRECVIAEEEDYNIKLAFSIASPPNPPKDIFLIL